MEKILQVIGAKVVENEMIELTLIPYTSKEAVSYTHLTLPTN